MSETYRGAYGTVDADEAGPPLTADEVAGLPDGTRVWIIWSGGNGPHTYRITVDEGDPARYAVALHDDPHGSMRYYNKITFIGDQRYHTRVWRDPR